MKNTSLISLIALISLGFCAGCGGGGGGHDSGSGGGGTPPEPPAPPTYYYGADTLVGLTRYDADGRGPTVIGGTPFDWGSFGGAAPVEGGVYLLQIGSSTIPAEIWYVDLATLAVTKVAESPYLARHMGIAASPDGLVYVVGFTGVLSVYDPSDGSFTTVGGVPAFLATTIEVDENGNVYLQDIAPTDDWVWKLSPADGYLPKPIVSNPYGFAETYGGGLAITKEGGTMYVGDSKGKLVYKCDDLDGDGAYLSPGEMVVCSDVTLGAVRGIALTEGGIIANETGGVIRRLTDSDGDGLFLTPGESEIWSSVPVTNGNTTSPFRKSVP